jgi:hypothetical protein
MIIDTDYNGIKIDTDTLKKIYVFMDRDFLYLHEHGIQIFLSHDSVEKNIAAGGNPIFTHCADFFDFDTLLMGYDVNVVRGDTWIALSQLLANDGRLYSTKEIYWQHNARKMLMTGALEFLPIPGNITDILKEELDHAERSRTFRAS